MASEEALSNAGLVFAGVMLPTEQYFLLRERIATAITTARAEGEAVGIKQAAEVAKANAAAYRRQAQEADKIDNDTPNFWAARARAVDCTERDIRALEAAAGSKTKVVGEQKNQGR